jgi:ribosomal protein L7/L12
MADQYDDIRGLVQSGRKIEAIKLYRERYGVGLAEAKDVIDELSAGKNVTFPTPKTIIPPDLDDSGQPNEALYSTFYILIRDGRKIEAIKLYREVYSVGLKEAKDVIDAMEAGESIPFPPPPHPVTPPRIAARNAEFHSLIDGMLRQGQKIEAIKLYRERTSLGLKEAKDAVDAREAELRARGDIAAKSGCFIATAAFGAEDAPEVLALRRFRDSVLVQSNVGQRFIRGYYCWSPPLAAWLTHHPTLCRLVCATLRPVVSIVNSRRR